MDDNQPPLPPRLPTRWLMTDPRLGAGLWRAIDRLPAGGGVLLRHDALDLAERLALGERVAARVRARGLLLSVARDAALAGRLGAAMVHGIRTETLPFSLPVHDDAQADAARTSGAAMVFVSPLFATRSHPGAPPLGAARARALADRSGVPAIALGGMDEARFAALGGGWHGWAGIDAWR